MKSLFTLIISLMLLACHSSADQAVEIGTVTYEPTLAKAVAKSQTSGKPVFLLFQEIPG